MVSLTDGEFYAEVDDSTSYGNDMMWRLLLHQDDNLWEGAVTQLDGIDELWYSEGTNILWTIAFEDTLYAFEDFLSGEVQDITATEVNVNPSTATKSVSVTWTQLTGAKKYLISWNGGDTTYSVPAGKVAGDTLSTTVSGLNPGTAYTFYIRVADGSPLQSRWSPSAAETTSWYILPPIPEVPAQGLQDAPLLPSFVWLPATGAVSYDFQLSTSPDISSPIVDTNVDATGYTVSSELAYDTNHYWRVRSVASDGTTSNWCTIQNFHTRTEEIPPVTVEPAPTPTINLPQPTVSVNIPDLTVNPPAITIEPPVITVPIPPSTVTTVNPVIEMPDEQTPVFIWVIVAIGAVLTIAVIVLIIRTRRVV